MVFREVDAAKRGEHHTSSLFFCSSVKIKDGRKHQRHRSQLIGAKDVFFSRSVESLPFPEAEALSSPEVACRSAMSSVGSVLHAGMDKLAPARRPAFSANFLIDALAPVFVLRISGDLHTKSEDPRSSMEEAVGSFLKALQRSCNLPTTKRGQVYLQDIQCIPRLGIISTPSLSWYL